jgi:hypothetical protein
LQLSYFGLPFSVIALLLLPYEEPATILLWFHTISYSLAACSLLTATKGAAAFGSFAV